MSTKTQKDNPLYNPGQKTRRQKEAERFAQFEEPNDLRAMLRVKVRSLQDEAQLIRRKEQGHPRGHSVRMQLTHHRKTVVRREARAAQLALCFLRGRKYIQAEQYVHPGCEPDWYNVRRNVEKFGYLFRDNLSREENRRRRDDVLSNFEEWQKQGNEDLIAARSNHRSELAASKRLVA